MYSRIKERESQIAEREIEIKNFLKSILKEPTDYLKEIGSCLEKIRGRVELDLKDFSGSVDDVSDKVRKDLHEAVDDLKEDFEDSLESLESKINGLLNDVTNCNNEMKFVAQSNIEKQNKLSEDVKITLVRESDNIKEDFANLRSVVQNFSSTVSHDLDLLLKRMEEAFGSLLDEKVVKLSDILQRNFNMYEEIRQFINNGNELIKNNFDKQNCHIDDVQNRLSGSIMPISEKSNNIMTSVEKIHNDMNEKIMKLESDVNEINRINGRNKIIFIVLLVAILLFSFSDGIVEVVSLLHKW